MSDIDIVEQLRREADSCADVCCIFRTANVMRTAADLITKLRADLATYQEERELLDQTIDKMSADLAAEREHCAEIVREIESEPVCCGLPQTTMGRNGPEQECCGSPEYGWERARRIAIAIRALTDEER